MLTQSAPTEVSVPRSHTFGKIAVGLSPNNNLLVAGITAGKSAGQPAGLARQASPYGNNNWQSGYTPLTGPAGAITLTDLVIASGTNQAHVVGMGNDGHLYLAGTEAGGQWAAGASPSAFSQSLIYQPGTLSAQALNTPAVFALSYLGAPCCAAYRDQSASPAWQPGFILNAEDINAYSQLVVRPDFSLTYGNTHAIGLTTAGAARAVGIAYGSGVGSTVWKAGAGTGALGGGATLPAFRQLLVVTGDAAGKMHVIGLGTDGSLWDIDQFTPSAISYGGTWAGRSASIAPAGTVGNGKIDCYLSSDKTLNLVAWSGMKLQNIAQFTSTWASITSTIPVAGFATDWHIAANCAANYGSVFILGVAGTGLVYELAYLNPQGVWEAGAQVPINK